jgi:hypothetical protein
MLQRSPPTNLLGQEFSKENKKTTWLGGFYFLSWSFCFASNPDLYRPNHFVMAFIHDNNIEHHINCPNGGNDND